MKSLSTVLAVIFVLAAALTPLTAHAHDAAVNDMSMAANLFITSLDNAQKKQGQIQSSKEYLLTDLGWLVTLLFRGSILKNSGRLVFFLGVR